MGVALISAFISASVAFSVLAISQWIIHRRERSRLLLDKLEELYLLLLQLGTRNMERGETAMVAAMQKAPLPKWHFDSMEKMLMADLLEKLEMLIEFYFPPLLDNMPRLFDANRDCTPIILTSVGKITPYETVNAKLRAVADELAVLKQRVLSERAELIKAWRAEIVAWFRRHCYG